MERILTKKTINVSELRQNRNERIGDQTETKLRIN